MSKRVSDEQVRDMANRPWSDLDTSRIMAVARDLLDARAKIAELEGLLQEKDAEIDKWRAFAHDPRQMFDVQDPCPKCSGLGRRAYGDTSTWRGGIGGQVITAGVCDECWGSGERDFKGANLRELNAKLSEQAAEIERLVALAKNDAEVIGYLGPQLTHEHLAREKAEQELQGHKDMIGAMEESARIRCLVCRALRRQGKIAASPAPRYDAVFFDGLPDGRDGGKVSERGDFSNLRAKRGGEDE